MTIPNSLEISLRTSKVIPFVGAGVSMEVKSRETGLRVFPSWRELLGRAADRLRKEKKPTYANAVQSLVELNKPDEFMRAAKLAREGLEQVWFTFLNEQLNPSREVIDDSSLELARSIWGLGSPLIITTNYDRVLHWACPQYNDLSYWDIEAPAEQVLSLRQQLEHPTVWHLHGYINNLANIILTPDGYSLLYPDAASIEAKYKAALATLRTLLATHSFLFIGFSLDDVHFIRQLEDVHQIFRGATGPHYVLMHESDAQRVGSAVPANVLIFKDFGQPLIRLLQEMSKGSDKSRSVTNYTESLIPTNTSIEGRETYTPDNTVFFVPYESKGERFIGRNETLSALHIQLTEGSPTRMGLSAVLIGLGGLGKTQLAVEYAHRYKDKYPSGVIWLSADQDIDAQLIQIAEKARWAAPETDQKIKLEIARHRMRTYSNSLLIVDNLDSIDKIINYLPDASIRPTILATSRVDHPHLVPVPLEPLDGELSLRLLFQEAGGKPSQETEWEAAKEIATMLGGLPLALEMAGAYLRHRPVSWRQYLDLLKKSLTAAMPDRFFTASVTGHEADLYSTLKLSEETFAAEPLLQEILDLLTWSGSSPMRKVLIDALLNIVEPIEITNALGLGAAMKILHPTPNGDSYTIHRLVREVRRKEMPLFERRDWVDTICQRMAAWFQESDEILKLHNLENETDHLQVWSLNARGHAPRHACRLTWLHSQALRERGLLRESKEVIEEAFELLGLDPDRRLEGSLFTTRGAILGQLGDFELSLQDLTKGLRIWKERDRETAWALLALASDYAQLSKYSLSLKYAQEALSISESLKHPGSRIAALTMMSESYRGLGDLNRGLETAKECLAISRQNFGESDSITAGALNSLGNGYQAKGDNKSALSHYLRAIQIEQKWYASHPNLASGFNNIGLAYFGLGDSQNALAYLEKALAIEKTFYDDKHPHTVSTAASLAMVLAKLDKRAEAYQLLTEYLQNLPKNHPFHLKLKSQLRQLLSKPLRSGFRQPASKKRKQKRKKGH